MIVNVGDGVIVLVGVDVGSIPHPDVSQMTEPFRHTESTQVLWLHVILSPQVSFAWSHGAPQEGMRVGEGNGVGVREGVNVRVGVRVGVWVGVCVRVGVWDGVIVHVGVRVGVCVRVGV